MLELTDLNTHCLLEVFKYCNWVDILSLVEVCHRLSDIIRVNIFPKMKEFECCLYCHGCQRVKKIINNIGQFVQRLNIRCYNIFSEINNVSFLEQCAPKIGTNIRELTLILPDFSMQHMKILKKIFGNLTSLKIITYSANQMDFDFRTFCPNLVHLYLAIKMDFAVNIGTWPKLQSLSLGDNCRNTVSPVTLLQFMCNNPQLKQLKISTRHGNWKIQDIVDHLPNLDTLTIMHDGGDFTRDLHLLNDLVYLTDLGIMRIHQEDIKAIVAELPKCQKLRRLRLQSCNNPLPRLDPIHHLYTVAQKLKHLVTLEVSECVLSETIVVEFIKAAAQLKMLHLHHCYIEFTETLILDINRVVLSMSPRDTEPLWICDDNDAIEAKVWKTATLCRGVKLFRCKVLEGIEGEEAC